MKKTKSIKRQSIKKRHKEKYWPIELSNPIPEALKKQGIKRIVTNLPPGENPPVSAKYIFSYFGDELIEQLRNRNAQEDE